MSLLIEVSQVPWRILDAVKRRILANRAKHDREKRSETLKGGARAERFGRGRKAREWKRKEPGATPTSGWGYWHRYEEFWYTADLMGANAECDEQAPPDGSDAGGNSCESDWKNFLGPWRTFYRGEGGETSHLHAMEWGSDATSVLNGTDHWVWNKDGTPELHAADPLTMPGAPFVCGTGPGRAVGWGVPNFKNRDHREFVNYDNCTVAVSAGNDRVAHKMVFFNAWTNKAHSVEGWVSSQAWEFGKTVPLGNPTALTHTFNLGDEGLRNFNFHVHAESVRGSGECVIIPRGSHNSYHVFIGSEIDKTGLYSPSRRRHFLVGDKVALYGEGDDLPSPAWYGTITSSGYGTYEYSVYQPTEDRQPQWQCPETPEIEPPPVPDEYPPDFPPPQWVEEWQGEDWPDESCWDHIHTVTGWRYVVQFSEQVPSKYSSLGDGEGAPFVRLYYGQMARVLEPSELEDVMNSSKVFWTYQYDLLGGCHNAFVIKGADGTDFDLPAEPPLGWTGWGQPEGLRTICTQAGVHYYFVFGRNGQHVADDEAPSGPFYGDTLSNPYAPNQMIQNQYHLPRSDSNGQVSTGPWAQVLQAPQDLLRSDMVDKKNYYENGYVGTFYAFDCTAGVITKEAPFNIPRATKTPGTTFYEYLDEFHADLALLMPDWIPAKKYWLLGYYESYNVNAAGNRVFHITGNYTGNLENSWVFTAYAINPQLPDAEYAEALLFENRGNLVELDSTEIDPKVDIPSKIDWGGPQPRPERWSYMYPDRVWVAPIE